MGRNTPIVSAMDQLIPILDARKIPFLVVNELEFEDVLPVLESSEQLETRVSYCFYPVLQIHQEQTK